MLLVMRWHTELRDKFGVFIVLYMHVLSKPHTIYKKSVLLQQKYYRSLHKTLKSSELLFSKED